MAKLSLKNTELPLYTMTLPVSGIVSKFRPFIVKEEKVLLIALQSKNQQQITDAMHKIVLGCTNNTVDTRKICAADAEYAFLQIRSKSIGEEAKPRVICSKCKSENNLKVRLDEFTLKTETKNENTNHIIQLYENIAVVMRYASIHDLSVDLNPVDAVFDITKKCVESMIVDEQVYTRNDIDPKELSDFIDNLTPIEFEKLTAYFETTPKLNYELQYTCPTCKEKVKVNFKNITDFF